LCYEFNDYVLGEEVSLFFLKNNTPQNPLYCDPNVYNEVMSYYNIFKKLNIYKGEKKWIENPIIENKKPYFCFVADGGFKKWSGSSIKNEGVGGSETYIIEMARNIQALNKYNVVVFCNCFEEEICDNVLYKSIDLFAEFVFTRPVQHCIVSRYSEYLPLCFKSYVENVYFVIHDLTPSGVVIPFDNKLKQIFCLTEWHMNFFLNIFPMFKPITVVFSHGINVEDYLIDANAKDNIKFIYSSFPNRGLLPLLEMWPFIINKFPKAELHIFSDVDGEYVNNVSGELMKNIKELIKTTPQIIYHGWVNKQILQQAWINADVWLYPCTFLETYCLTALEAAISKTLIIANDMGALINTVGDRGILISGDSNSLVWKQEALQKLFEILDPKSENKKQELIDANYNWAKNLTWKNQAEVLVNTYMDNLSLSFVNEITNFNLSFIKNHIDIHLPRNTLEERNEHINILEIGTYCGTNLINFIQNTPFSKGEGIDIWKNTDDYPVIETFNPVHLFYNNVNLAKLNTRIRGLQGNSTEILMQKIKNNEKFHFIFVDGSKKEIIQYMDIVYSWELLYSFGCIIINKMNMSVEALNNILFYLQNNTKSHKIVNDNPFLYFIKQP